MTDRRDETPAGDVPTGTTPGLPGTAVTDEPGTVTGSLTNEWQQACAATSPGSDNSPSSGTSPLFARQDWPVGAALAVVQAIEEAAATISDTVATDGAPGERAILSRAAAGWALAHGSALIMRDRLEMLDGLLGLDTSARGPARQEACRQLTALATRCSLERLEQAALVDPLTGAGNRRALETTLSRMIASAQRFGHELAVVTIDLDGLKSINDTHGHEAGDAALTSLVTAFTTTLREVDAIFRTGGDEFVVVLPGASADDVASVMTRVAALGAPSFSWGSIARKPDSDLRAEDLLAVADMNLYARRRAHRRSARRARSYHRLRLATVAAAFLLVAGVLVGHGIVAPPTAHPHHVATHNLHDGRSSRGAGSGVGGNPAGRSPRPPGSASSSTSRVSAGSADSMSGDAVATELAADTGSISVGGNSTSTTGSPAALDGGRSGTGSAPVNPAKPAPTPGAAPSPAGQRPATHAAARSSHASPKVASRPASSHSPGPTAGTRGGRRASSPGFPGSRPVLAAAVDTAIAGGAAHALAVAAHNVTTLATTLVPAPMP